MVCRVLNDTWRPAEWARNETKNDKQRKRNKQRWTKDGMVGWKRKAVYGQDRLSERARSAERGEIAEVNQHVDRVGMGRAID